MHMSTCTRHSHPSRSVTYAIVRFARTDAHAAEYVEHYSPLRTLLRFTVMNQRSGQAQQNDFSIEEYGAKTAETEECEEQLLREYATLLGFYVTSVAVLTGIAAQKNSLPRKFTLLDLALLGLATHKLSRIIAKDRVTGIIRAPFVNYICGAGAGEVEEEPRGRGFQRGIGHLISCPYCMAPWCATGLSFGLLFAPRVTRFFAGILVTVTASDFLHRAYARMKQD